MEPVTTDESGYHYWMPVPGDFRHAIKGARRWRGERAATTICGTEVALAAPSEMDWIFVRTCPYCWTELIREQDREPADSSWRSSPRDIAIARESLSKAEQSR